MLTLTTLAIALAGTAFLGSVAAMPVVTSHDAIIPIVTATETFINAHGSLTTATITISQFTRLLSKAIAGPTPLTANNAGTPNPGSPDHQPVRSKPTGSPTSAQGDTVSPSPAYGRRPSTFSGGVPIYVGRHKHSGLQNMTRIGGPGIAIAREVHTAIYGHPAGFLAHTGRHKPSVSQSIMHPLPPHETETPHHHKAGKSDMPDRIIPITEGDIAAMHTVGPEGGNNK